jgi:hypothetical protein
MWQPQGLVEGVAYHPIKWTAEREDQPSPLWALLWIKPLFQHFLKEKKARGNLVIVL